DADGDGDRIEDRNLNTIRDGDGPMPGWWKMGDAFHSIPNIVERPVGKGLGVWSSSDSYEAFKTANGDRKKAILIGSNDGMLHAIHAGTWNSSTELYDNGTGEELWAFVSPELLPELQNYCNPASGGCSLSNHGFMVDGSVMVRDIWIGGTDDKNDSGNSSKWKTVAIYGHRRGGTTYVALDVTDIDNPKFLWQFPQAGDTNSAGVALSGLMGQSWLDTYPAPSSIGPLGIDSDSDGDIDYDQWVVLLPGGYDPLDTKGNMLFIADAYTGEALSIFDKTGGGELVAMDYSFPATPVYYSSLASRLPYIAGIVAVDHGGQLWHIPTPPAQITAGKISNFTPQIVFRATATLVTPDTGNGIITLSEYQPRPFFFAPTLTRHGATVRVLMGSGDRDMLIPDADLSIQGATITSDINTAVCSATDTYIQRLYAVDLSRCKELSGAEKPCTEADLQEIIPASDQYALSTHRGWYLKLAAGEKSAAPYDVFGGYALYPTFRPGWPCASSTSLCNATSPGDAYIYARHILTGKTLDWDGDGVILASDEAIRLGEGVPTAPSMSVGVGDGEAAPTLLVGASDQGQVSKQLDLLQTKIAEEIMHFPVPRAWCEALH
ncbi:hypothetical protein KAI87_14360, partial [Myxococcota bacterium]|nr:hypothetical protein [Myxococcota bacterium]